MKKIILLLVTVFMLVSFTQTGLADDIKGYMIPEYYSVAGHHEGEEGIEGQHGFWLRRIYFGYNTKLADNLSARVRFEMNSPAYEEDKMVAYVKNAHLKYSLGGGAALIGGIIEPPSFDKVEKFWGHRYIEKTAPDLFKFASSRDFGLALGGKTKGGLVYTVMYGNYGSNKGEDNQGKGVYGRLGYEANGFYLEANGHLSSDNGSDYLFLSGFAGIKGGWGNIGANYIYLDKAKEDDSESMSAISAFTTVKLGKKTNMVLRYDHMLDPALKHVKGYLRFHPDAPARLLIAALTFKVHKMVQLSPNVKYVFYGDPATGAKPDGDFYINLTAKVSFKTKL
jgi:hypothetical protein